MTVTDTQQPVINRELLLLVLGHIVAEPESWKQSSWFTYFRGEYEVTDAETACGTAGCLAGWTAALSPDITFPEKVNVPGQPVDPEARVSETVLYRGRAMHVSVAAQLALGLTGSQANNLFSGGNSLPEIVRQVRILLGRGPVERKAGDDPRWLITIPEFESSYDTAADIEVEIDKVLGNHKVGVLTDRHEL